jgi:hypothetical protein
VSKATDTQEAAYAKLLNNDPQIQQILAQLKALPNGLSDSVFGAPDSKAKQLQDQYTARMKALGIDLKTWKPSIDWSGATPTISVDHQNIIERHPDETGALAVGGLFAAGFLVPALGGAGLGGGGGAGAGAGTGASAGGGMSTAQKITLAAAGVGTAIDIAAKVKAGNDQKQTDEYNASVEDALAQDALTRGQLDEQKLRAQIRGTIGRQRAGFAGQGVDVGVGSAVDAQADAGYLGELDAQTVRANAAREAFGHTVNATNFRNAGQVAQTTSRFGAADTALTTTTSLLASRYGWGR